VGDDVRGLRRDGLLRLGNVLLEELACASVMYRTVVGGSQAPWLASAPYDEVSSSRLRSEVPRARLRFASSGLVMPKRRAT